MPVGRSGRRGRRPRDTRVRRFRGGMARGQDGFMPQTVRRCRTVCDRERRFRRSRCGAPGRIRTCGTRFRRAVLYPLSYEGVRRAYLGLPSSSLPPSTCWGTSGAHTAESNRSARSSSRPGTGGRRGPGSSWPSCAPASSAPPSHQLRTRSPTTPQCAAAHAGGGQAPPRGAVNSRSSDARPSARGASSRVTNRGSGTVRRAWVLGVPHTSRPDPDGIEMPRSKRHDDKTIVVWQPEPLPIN